MKTVLNLSIDAHRSSISRGEQVLLEDVVIIDPSPGVEDELLGRELLARMNVCLARLNDKPRAMLLAHRVEGLSYEEIARQYGVSISTVNQHIAKALMQVTGWMHGWYP